MSKVYDFVNLKLVYRSLKYINILSKLIYILTNLLTDYYYNLGLIDLYSVNNEINQGKTITLLFWQIYYDLLISKIATQFTDYILTIS